MKNRFYLKAELQSVAPLAIGSGLSDFTDKDVLLGTDGKPYIPGSSIAGVCRHYLVKKYNESRVSSLFGEMKDDTESRIVFYNCGLVGDFVRTFRDGVKIGEDGTAVDTGKFDYEIVELKGKASYFSLRIEIEDYSEKDRSLIDDFLCGIDSGIIRVGHKTNRGFGQFKLNSVSYLTCTNVSELLNFSWDKVNNTYSYNITEAGNNTKSQDFAVRSFMTVSYNATNIPKPDVNDGIINSEVLKNNKGMPIIPGTSWAGVFRHHFERILSESGIYKDDESRTNAFLNKLFGTTENASLLVFNESEVKNSKLLLQTRNAIDRFTGGACDKKLFTNQLAFGGTFRLVVSIKPGLTEEEQKLADNLIELTFADLSDGSLNVGGLGSVGGGMLKKAEA